MFLVSFGGGGSNMVMILEFLLVMICSQKFLVG